MVNYFELKCDVMEDFYIDNIQFEKYNLTIPQIVDKAIYECVSEDELYKLIVYTTLITRVAMHERESLSIFKDEIEMIKKMISKKELLQRLSKEELEDLKYQLEFFL